MRALSSVVIGLILGFAAMLMAITAGVFLLLGVGGHLLLKHRPGTSQMINYDPRHVVLVAPAAAAAALALTILFVVIYFKAGRRPASSQPGHPVP